jgi:hypothetical protein
MARTTIDIDHALLRELKKKTAAEGRTLQAVVNEHLKRAARAPSGLKYRLRLTGWQAEPRPGVDLFDRDKLLGPLEGR